MRRGWKYRPTSLANKDVGDFLVLRLRIELKNIKFACTKKTNKIDYLKKQQLCTMQVQ